VLLEDFAIATMPHGPALLEALKSPLKYAGPDSLLTLGDVNYNTPAWPALPSTRVEINVLAALAPSAPSAPTVLTKSDATAIKLAEALPKARCAHLATHGEFKAEEFAVEKKRELDARRNWQEGMGKESRRVAAKNPLAFVSIVLANGEVMSGLSILDLNLENLKLVTLSACETGLGEYTGGKGVENLQMAFHLAGCENVVASLWKVKDAATAALMAKFYHEIWVNKKSPIEALREAQLTIYYHPELILDLAGERGAPKLKEAVVVQPLAAAPVKLQPTSRADTKLWAAFVLSGVGK
jgi:CHAT domain-containing protein